MNKVPFLGLAGLLLGSEVHAQDSLEQKAAQTSSAFDEVLEFINGKLELYGFGKYSGIDLGGNGGGETRSYTQKVEKESNCHLRFIYKETAVPWNNGREKEERVTVTQVALELSVVSVLPRVESFPSYDRPLDYEVKIQAVRRGVVQDIFPVKVEIIHSYPVTRYDSSLRESLSHQEYSGSSLAISFFNLEAAEDVRGMLNYALELCKAKRKLSR
ncbi:hypothetical protein HZA98_03230 [Candidatus Woesearchaeota archaeon]|nr:hypothetical protein [Candidatus Woesearchaeota archaeon]